MHQKKETTAVYHIMPWMIPGAFLILWVVVSESGRIPTYLLPHPRDIWET